MALLGIQRRQPLGGVLPDCLEHREAQPLVAMLRATDETRVCEDFEFSKDIEVDSANGFGRVERPSAGEHRESSEQLACGWIEGLLAPAYARFQRSVALRRVPRPSRQERQPVLEALGERGQVEGA